METTVRVVSLGLVGCVCLAGVARADEETTEAPLDIPGFVTLDRADGRSFFELDGGMSFFEGDDPDFNLRMDLHGQYVSPSGAGGYATLPIAFLADNDDSETALGNVEFGGIYNIRQSPTTSIALRGGLTLPTANSDDLGEAIVRFATMYGRLTDLTSVSAKVTWLRLAISPIYRDGNVFFRADGGLDLAIDSPDDSDVDPLVRFDVGAGIIAGSVALTAELVTVGTTGDVDEGDDRFFNTLALSACGGLSGSVQGFGALVVPLDSDEFLVDVDFVFVAGVRVPLGR